MNNYDSIIINLDALCAEMEELRAACIIGSRARSDRPADAFSDLDIILIVSDVDWFLNTDAWLHRLGNYHISFMEETVAGDCERRILFDGALDVDIVLIDEKKLCAAVESGEAAGILSRGYKILADKIGIDQAFKKLKAKTACPPPMSERQFLNLTHDFWYHCVWAGKKLLRGEMWAAKSCLDSYMKGKLLRMMETHAKAVHGPDYDTWHDGRYLDTWLDPRLHEMLTKTFGAYTPGDSVQTLLASMALFRALCSEAAALLHYSYPEEADREASRWVDENLSTL